MGSWIIRAASNGPLDLSPARCLIYGHDHHGRQNKNKALRYVTEEICLFGRQR